MQLNENISIFFLYFFFVFKKIYTHNYALKNCSYYIKNLIIISNMYKIIQQELNTKRVLLFFL
jgi:hypothetical protein